MCHDSNSVSVCELRVCEPGCSRGQRCHSGLQEDHPHAPPVQLTPDSCRKDPATLDSLYKHIQRKRSIVMHIITNSLFLNIWMLSHTVSVFYGLSHVTILAVWSPANIYSQHCCLTMLNCAGRMSVVTLPLRIGHFSVAGQTCYFAK